LFTGIIEETGMLGEIKHGEKSSVLTIKANKVLEETKTGDSIAVNGICLTVTSLGVNYFTADVMAESLRKTNLKDLKRGSRVNLERALSLSSRLGGHIVSGHVDGTGMIESFQREDNAVWISIQADEQLLKYIVGKGSIAIDGVSLTVAYIDDVRFKVSVIPHTGKETILLQKKPGDTVNLECDIIGKYVEKLMFMKKESRQSGSGIDMSFLEKTGFV